jgi:hypothetical protein
MTLNKFNVLICLYYILSKILDNLKMEKVFDTLLILHKYIIRSTYLIMLH